MTQEKQDVIYHQKARKILLQIYANGWGNKNNYPSKLGFQTQTTYPHAMSIINQLVEINILERLKIGRKLKLTVTDKGKEIIELLVKLESHVK